MKYKLNVNVDKLQNFNIIPCFKHHYKLNAEKGQYHHKKERQTKINEKVSNVVGVEEKPLE